MTTNTMDDATVQQLVAAEFASLADDLATVDAGAWDQPSLCSEWTVREVVAHVSMAARYSDEDFGARLAEYSFDFTKLSNEIARVDGEREPSELIKDLRSEALARWTPPGGGPLGALNHVVVHGLDATAALGLERSGSPDALIVVLTELTAGGVHKAFDIVIDGLRFAATDLEWSFGDGNPVTGPAAELVLQLTGRRIPSFG